jgi:septation ring formation regulator EzrA
VTSGIRNGSDWIEECSGSLERQPLNVEQVTGLLEATQEKLNASHNEMKANQLCRILIIVNDARNLKSFEYNFII